ncbi:BTAD domain-containing putative transcriptional regulator [Streptomyces sp. JNUCC 64]
MRFKMLGPLEVSVDGRPIALGGIKQRAALGFLLLQPNQVVSTSQLLRALWSVEGAPATARKILQNAIWGLRRALTDEGERQGPAALRTRPPGYTLQVDRDLIDHHQFTRWVDEGRSRLAAGAPEDASLLLRDALALWRGPALSDLVEAGVLWPELSTLQDTRLGVQEDFFEAQLASGQHYPVLGELEVMVDNEPLRERSCGQLMRALYRCGRQADALGVYSRLRTALVEDLGLEPSRELRTLQQAILTHDPSLQLPESRSAVLTRPGTAPFAERPEPPAPGPAPTGHQEPGGWERRRAATLLVRTEPDPELEADGGFGVNGGLDAADSLVRREIERFGGVFAGAMGGVSLGLFPAGAYGDEHSARAVRAAVAVRDRIAGPSVRAVRRSPEWSGVGVRVAVTTGEALVQTGPGRGGPASVNGALLHECQALLPLVPLGEIRVCGRTRSATEGLLAYQRVADGQESWQVRAAPGERAGGIAPAEGHARELELLTGLLDHTARWRRPHQAVVLGASDTARTRVLGQLRDRLAGDPSDPLVLTPDGTDGADPYALYRRVLAGYCGITEQDPPTDVWQKLGDAVGALARGPAQARWLMARLGPVLEGATEPVPDLSEPDERRLACVRFVEAAAQHRPLVLIDDAAHRADDALGGFLEEVHATGRPVPLLAVTGARPEASAHCSRWLGSRWSVTTITLGTPPAPDPGAGRLAAPWLALTLEAAPVV